MIKLLEIGYYGDQPLWLNQKVKITNVLILVIFSICVFFTGISFFFLKPIMYLPVIASIVVLSGFLLNYLRLYTLSRYLIVAVPFVLSLVYNASISNDSVPPLHTLWGITIAFSIPIFIIFDHREIKYSVSGFVAMLLFLCFFDQLDSSINESGLDYAFANGIFFSLLCIVATFSINMSALVYQLVQFKNSEENTQRLITDLENKQEEMLLKEKEIGKTIAELQLEKEKDEQRSWSVSGLNNLTELMRNVGAGDSSVTYDKVISFLVKWLNANQASLFLVEEDESSKGVILKLKSIYAYNRKKYLEKTIEVGVGLVGQCYVEGEKIILTEVPEGYITIGSGLGESTPRCLILIPLKSNDHMEGVFEIASFKIFNNYEIEFLERVGEIMTGFIRTIKSNEKTQILLDLSRVQEEKLREAEEEMRQNLEEMQATIEEANRKEQVYLDRITFLESKN